MNNLLLYNLILLMLLFSALADEDLVIESTITRSRIGIQVVKKTDFIIPECDPDCVSRNEKILIGFEFIEVAYGTKSNIETFVKERKLFPYIRKRKNEVMSR